MVPGIIHLMLMSVFTMMVKIIWLVDWTTLGYLVQN